jgi:hypothetical protein
MKKVLFGAVIVMTVFACKTENKEVSNTSNPNQDGITINKSSNIDVVKEINEDLVIYDLAKLRSHYSDSAKVHDNQNIQLIDTNLATFIPLKNAGVKFSIVGKPLIFEIVNSKPDSVTGYTNYVDTYYTIGISRGNLKKSFILNQVFAIKDGKILEEWDTYDTAPMMELMK